MPGTPPSDGPASAPWTPLVQVLVTAATRGRRRSYIQAKIDFVLAFPVSLFPRT